MYNTCYTVSIKKDMSEKSFFEYLEEHYGTPDGFSRQERYFMKRRSEVPHLNSLRRLRAGLDITKKDFLVALIKWIQTRL